MNSIAGQIEDEIRRRGPMSLARFMELALYAPGLGYYERQREIGRRGDFFTSVSVGSLFGELLAFQFAQWWDSENTSGDLQIIEAGAHEGRLAGDMLDWFQRWRPDLFARLDFCLIEPSPLHREWQTQNLAPWLSKVKWRSHLSELASGKASRIVFCNELLDAMPVHRLTWNAAKREWRECRVACTGQGFAWQVMEMAGSPPNVDLELAAILPEGFIIEYSPMAIAWWKQAAETLGHGKLLTIDYGLTSDERFSPERRDGALRAFAAHHLVNDPLENPGECDITSHIDFSAIEQAGHSAGLWTEAFITQAKFLTQILAQTQAVPGHFAAWTPARVKQFQTLTHPEHLGRAFRALVQSRAG
ncbi:MAG TPA: SAM-dependent methyltransferase [Candidatus Saccharimonadales bacterium]|nr:SAM-dependent methyltransferase [Candidatus Saccharimonadales bacterium]